MTTAAAFPKLRTMTPERAIHILGDLAPACAVTAESRPNYYGGAWVVWARVDDYARPLTQFAEPFSAARWVNRFDALLAEAK